MLDEKQMFIKKKKKRFQIQFPSSYHKEQQFNKDSTNGEKQQQKTQFGNVLSRLGF